MDGIVWALVIGGGLVFAALLIAQFMRAGSGDRREHEEEGWDDHP